MNLLSYQYHGGNLKIKMRNALLVLMMLFSSCATIAHAEPPRTVMYLTGEITPKTVLPLIVNLGMLNKLPAAQRPAVVVIEINSGGGEYEAGFLLTKAIESSPIQVLCQVDGTAASEAFFILQSCDARSATARSVLMWHNVTLSEANVTAVNASSLAKYVEVLNKAALNHVSKKLKLTKDEVAEKIRFADWWMSPDEALTFGAIDAVIP